VNTTKHPVQLHISDGSAYNILNEGKFTRKNANAFQTENEILHYIFVHFIFLIPFLPPSRWITLHINPRGEGQ